MDQMKIGSFIRQLRKEQGLTQKELAQKLFVTDRAVSKWERGLSSPDISLLKLLSETLGVSVSELIQGEREIKPASVFDEKKLESVLEYSGRKLKEKLLMFRKKYLGITISVGCLLLISVAIFLWQSGVFFLIERSASPDGNYSVAVYSRNFQTPDFSSNDFYLSVKDCRSGTVSYMTCKNTGSIELWWSPDSQKLVVLSGDSNAVIDFSNGVSFDYRARLSDAAIILGFEDIDYDKPDVHYRLLQWGEDSESLLLYYYYIGKSSKPYDGYFWYNCVTGELSGKFEMNSKTFSYADAETPLTKMLYDDTATEILENFNPDDCEEILTALS